MNRAITEVDDFLGMTWNEGGIVARMTCVRAGRYVTRFHGACHGCPSSTMTLQMGIERNLREKVPEVTAVVPVA